MKAISKEGINLIKRYEGFEGEPYKDAAGFLTIGYGHLINAYDKLNAKSSITEKEAELILLDDILEAATSINNLIKVDLNQNQFDALVSFTFNVGAGNLKRSTLRKMINNSKLDDAANEFSRWIYAGGKQLKGLIRRREAERMLFLKPIKISV